MALPMNDRFSRRDASAGRSDPYYIVAADPLPYEHRQVLKHGDTFAVFDHYGDMYSEGPGDQGLYHEGTRFLSCFVLNIGQDRPLFLSSAIKEDNDVLSVDLTNRDCAPEGSVAIPRGTLHLARLKVLWQNACYECLSVKNYGMLHVTLLIRIRFDADFMDIFEVRGTSRRRRGQRLETIANKESVVLAYCGLDNVTRRTRLIFSPPPEVLSTCEAGFQLSLDPGQDATLCSSAVCESNQMQNPVFTFGDALRHATGSVKAAQANACNVHTSNEQVNAWFNRTAADLHMMNTQTHVGLYPYAGVPWYCAPFGRDGIVTAFECLWANPDMARGVLAFLASTQATRVSPEEDAEPGKIVHEMRKGEMAALNEIPFGQYYGSVDATPLFVVLAGAYYERTGDVQFLDAIWPNIEAALHWIDDYGDKDHDGFVEYFRCSHSGLSNHGWKDSKDSIFHANGTLAQGPIALCEVQGYVYAAKCYAAELAEVLGRHERADICRRQARALRDRFEESYWCEDLGTYAIALDGEKRRCKVRTSNAGHCLMAGIVSPERAHQVADTLLAQESFSGWGIRTVAATELRYNPMSYHNGSVWPHDNALIGYGFARYGLKHELLRILTGLFDASQFVDLHRLPELFCGFARRPGEGPTLYPVACAPQAWSAASVSLLAQSCLGLRIRVPERQVSFHDPVLPPFLKEITIRGLRVGDAVVDLQLLRHGEDVGINVVRRDGDVAITMAK
jgi:glycogen debranching enzyme